MGIFIVPSHLIAGKPLIENSRSGARAYNMHSIAFLEQFDERIHGTRHLCIVHCAYIEVEFFKSFFAHSRILRHRRAGVAQHHPTRLRQPAFDMDFFQI